LTQSMRVDLGEFPLSGELVIPTMETWSTPKSITKVGDDSDRLLIELRGFLQVIIQWLKARIIRNRSTTSTRPP
jgi:hypothetical protein